ncbi:MAG TPA: S8 family serine peptidase, partial [Anaerolineaceae bacterium]|nr:S8 family serine peptidase [Anaerolineaceae bacterium]
GNSVERGNPQAKSTIPGLEYNLEQLFLAAASGDKVSLESFKGMQFVDLENATARVILELDTPSGVKKTGEPWVEVIPGGDGSQIEIHHTAPVSVRLDLELGLKATGAQLETATDRYVQVMAPFSSLQALTHLPGVRRVRLPFPSQQTVGAFTSQGVNNTNANTWQAAGYDGDGIIVGVFDFGFTGWAGLQSSGDLPPGTRLVLKDYNSTYNFNPDTPDMKHGAACAEIIYDMAPGSTIYLYAFYTEVELQNAINDFMNVNGKRIASMSIGWVNAGPYDGSGEIGDMITAAKNDGILWFTSAGNNQTQHWSGTATQYSGSDAIAFGTGNINAFGPVSGSVWNLPVGFDLSLYLEWNDWNAARTGNQNNIDYDIELYRWDGSTWAYVTGSYENQCTSSAYPLESIDYTVATAGYYGFAVWRTNSANCPNSFGHWMNLHTFSGFFQTGVGASNSFWVNNHCNSIMIPADSVSNVTVGATYWGEDGTASLYGLETFSSLGPRNAAGGANPGATVNKPDVVAPDGVTNGSYGINSGINYANGGAGFWGTSAAAPHAAGLAATIWEDNPNFSIAQLRSYLTTHAVYKANGGSCGGSLLCATQDNQLTSAQQNNRYGWGRIDVNNTAPVLDAGGTMNLAALNEDDTANSGALVSAIISSAGGDRITDVDAESYEGIAVTGVDNT